MEAAKKAGISYRIRTGVMEPSVPARGAGTRREFSHTDVELLLVLASLRQEGYELRALRQFAREQAVPWREKAAPAA